MVAKPTPSIEIFYCYARKDQDLRDELDTHLSALHRSGLVKSWYDGGITPGTPWEEAIEAHLNVANIILLLISPDFLKSDYCYSKEMTRAIDRHEAGDARVIPILLRPVDWTGAPFSKLQMLPVDARPITRWPDRDEAFEKVARGIRQVVNELIEQYKAEAQRRREEQERIEIVLERNKQKRNSRVRVSSASQQSRASYSFWRSLERNPLISLSLLIVGMIGLVVYTSFSSSNERVIHTFDFRTESTTFASLQNTPTSNVDQQARQKDFENVTKNIPTVSGFQVDDGWHVSYLKPDRSCIISVKNYTASIKQNAQYIPCIASNVSYKNFALQVTMSIKGDAGGVIFRSHDNANIYYRLAMNVVNADKPTFTLLLCDKEMCSATDSNRGKVVGTAVLAKVDKHPITMTVIVRNEDFDVYANGKFVTRFIDSTNVVAGQIGVYAAEDKNETIVYFSDLKVWSLDGK